MSKAEWCKNNGYKEHQMYYWIQKIYKPEVKPKQKVDFLPVNIIDETEKDNEPVGSVLIHIDRMSVEVRLNTDIDLLSNRYSRNAFSNISKKLCITFYCSLHYEPKICRRLISLSTGKLIKISRQSRQTLSNWMVEGADCWLAKIYDRMREHLLEKEILHADETALQVLRESGRVAESKSYMWLYRNGRGRPPNILFEYQRTRASKHPKKFLLDFKGYLHVDGYRGYDSIPNFKN